MYTAQAADRSWHVYRHCIGVLRFDCADDGSRSCYLKGIYFRLRTIVTVGADSRTRETSFTRRENGWCHVDDNSLHKGLSSFRAQLSIVPFRARHCFSRLHDVLSGYCKCR